LNSGINKIENQFQIIDRNLVVKFLDSLIDFEDDDYIHMSRDNPNSSYQTYKIICILKEQIRKIPLEHLKSEIIGNNTQV
jgi:hypothetical protein